MVGLTNQIECPGGPERLFQWLGSDQRELDPKAMNQELHTATRILLDDEKVLMAFRAGRDTTVFTNLRVLTLDVQGLSGLKIQYTSIPFKRYGDIRIVLSRKDVQDKLLTQRTLIFCFIYKCKL